MSIRVVASGNRGWTFMCCGRRMVLMPYAGIWAIGCTACERFSGRDEPIFIIQGVHEIGTN